jgi:hypothetical protein
MLRQAQLALMTETVRVIRNGVTVYASVPARITASRLFTEPGDPHDANLRSTREVGFTLPYTYDVHVGDVIEKTDGSLSTIAGEVLTDDTWKTALRVWATRPKLATPTVTITIYRYQPPPIDDWTNVGNYDVQVVFDRVAPFSSPLRYSPAGRSSYQGGTVVGGLSFAPMLDDRFTINGMACIITEVLPVQPQHVEAKFTVDVGGVD